MSLIYKIFSIQSKAIDKEAGIYEVMISTESTDRQGDIVRASGGKFENYLKNPVVLLGHDYSDLPIAKTLEIGVIPGIGIQAKFQFPENGLYEKADTTRKLWDAGFLNAASIGFSPLKSINLDPNKPWGPQDYIEWELLEWSIVTVPANQDALRLALDNINQTIEKRGRILSAANEKRLKDAAQALNDVLKQLDAPDTEPEPSEQDDNGKSADAESNTDLTGNDANKAEAVEKINQLLSVLFEV